MKKWICALLALALASGLAGCGAGKSDGGVYAEDGYAEGRMGDVMHTVFFDYTVNSAYTCDTFEGYTPEEGNQLLVAEVTVKNTDRATIEMYDTDFQVQWGGHGEDEYDFPITLYSDETVSDAQLPGVYELGIAEERTGLLVYEVPAGEKDFSISYMEVFADESEGDLFFVFLTANAQEA